MIYVEMNGRLGNQMFRYSFARWLQVKGNHTDEKLVLDFSNILKEKKREDAWLGRLSGTFSESSILIL